MIAVKYAAWQINLRERMMHICRTNLIVLCRSELNFTVKVLIDDNNAILLGVL